jgi:uncharacterized protein (DUF1015 family)
VPRFQTFAGVRYAAEDGYVDAVVAPPRDVISDEDRSRLEAASEHNAVRLEAPGADDPAELFRRWKAEGALVADDAPSFYVYRMGFHDDGGRPRQTSGVIGALELDGGVLPHERATPEDRAGRLELLRSTQINVSPIWALSPAAGLSALCEPTGPPDLRATDDQGAHHRLWRVTQPGVTEAIAAAVASAPVVIADGHHRFGDALAYRAEAGGAPGPWDSIMAYVVELAEEQLCVRSIHRLLSGLPEGFDLVAALEPFFEPFEAPPADATLLRRMEEAGALGLVTSDGAWLLRSRSGDQGVDAHLLDAALTALPAPVVRYQHDLDETLTAVRTGAAQAAVLLRPPTVGQIAEVARGGRLMPPKTTFFWPKPRTGLVFRELSA